jgi:methyltransferase (TIGR00027 family)
MARNPAAQTAFGPMVQVAIEQHEPRGRRLVDDPLAVDLLPAGQHALVRAMGWSPLRHSMIRLSERIMPGSWALIACRKRFIDDRLADALEQIDALVDLGAGLDTRACRLTLPSFEVDQPVNIARKRDAIMRALGAVPASVHLVGVDFEHDDLVDALRSHGYDDRWHTFFIWEGVTQYLTEEAVRATLDALRPVAAGSRIAFTFVPKDFIDGVNMYGAQVLYRRFRQRSQVWQFGIEPDAVEDVLADYGWRVIEQAGPEYFARNYLVPTGRRLCASGLEWSVYAEKIAP